VDEAKGFPPLNSLPFCHPLEKTATTVPRRMIKGNPKGSSQPLPWWGNPVVWRRRREKQGRREEEEEEEEVVVGWGVVIRGKH